MLNEIDPHAHGPFGAPMAEAVRACVHCGFCLAACPTYGELGQEADTPRGRIVLMKEVLEGSLDLDAAMPHLDQCLGCLACEPACPSGVKYRELISPFRALADGRRRRTIGDTLRRKLVAATLPHPARFRVAAAAAQWAAPLRPALPPKLRPMLDLLPASLPPAQSLAEVNPARGARRARVALLAGCAQQVLDPDINAATVEVLTRNGVEVIVPSRQACCGALSWHVGDHAAAMRFARRNLAAFPSDLDAIVTNTAGCGSGMHEYPLVLRDTDAEDAARRFAERVCDVSVFLDRLGDLAEIPDSGETRKVAYHDACHLSHGQGVCAEPRRLLRRIPGLELVEVRNGHLCCGSAGTYNIDQPEIAASLGRKKAGAVAATGAATVATGNIGCATQLRLHLARLGAAITVRHTIQILRDACADE